MTNKEAIEIFKAHQNWRLNSKESLGNPESAIVGAAINHAIDQLKRFESAVEVDLIPTYDQSNQAVTILNADMDVANTHRCYIIPKETK
jgi:hypothetical protein